MELHQLRYFLAVARTQNFSRAAEQCHVAQPSLSQQIMKLEDELGERLFERTKRTVALTPAGECLRERAERVLDELDAARDEIREVRGLLRGRVEVGALPTVAPYLLPTLLRSFGERYPGIEVVVHEDTTVQLVRAVEAKELELAITSLPIERRGLVAEKLFDEELLVVLPRTHPLAAKPKVGLRDIEGETFILMQEGHCLAGQVLQVCQLRGFAPRVSFRSAQIETVQAFVAAGFGVSIVPAMARRSGPETTVVYRSFTGTPPRRDIGLIHRKDRSLSRAAQAFAMFLREGGKAQP